MRAILVLSINIAILAMGHASGATWYVDSSVPSSGDGKSWATGFQTIQEGIDASSHGDTVIVAEGTYVENIQINGKNIVLQSTDPLDPAVVAGTGIDGNQSGSVVTFSGTETEACVLSGFTIRNGESSGDGGGIRGGTYAVATGATIQNNTITGNWALLYDGGGLAFCCGTIQNNRITGNWAQVYGGGLYRCDGRILNNMITANWAGWDGGGLSDCDGAIRNNTITGNTGQVDGGGLRNCNGTIRNCIVWENSAPTGRQLHQSSIPTYSCIQGWPGGGEGNIALDPQFVDPDGPDDDPETFADNDYRLSPNSPCTDAGINEDWMWSATDLDGNPRILRGPLSLRVDMGAYEQVWISPKLYVDGSVSSSGDGKSWATAFRKIQEGIDASSDSDAVIVAEGTYVENVKFNGKNIILTSTNPLDPAVVSSTIIDGNRAGSVVTFSGTETEACILSGFTITNGRARYGGGIQGGTEQCTRAGIQNNIIRANFADLGGGLSFCYGTIEKNTVTENGAKYDGGGLYGCDGTIRNNTITQNSSRRYGGGLYGCDGAIQDNTVSRNSVSQGGGGGLAGCGGTIQNNTVRGNSAFDSGGGLAFCPGLIRDNVIAGNWAVFGGGLNDCWGTIQNNTIVGNHATYGGAMNDCRGTIQSNSIAANFGDEQGGGLYGCDAVILNNTIAQNFAGYGGAGLHQCAGPIRNCIIWGNWGPQATELLECSVPAFSCIPGWTAGGEGNIGQAPCFIDPDGTDDNPDAWEDNNYRLRGDSPCIDTGRNEDWMWTASDLDGNPRIVFGVSSETVDMGAYEYNPFRIAKMTVDPGGTARLTWNSRPGNQYVIWSCSDLTSGDWTHESAVPSAGNSTSWIDPSPGGSRKFYRVERK